MFAPETKIAAEIMPMEKKELPPEVQKVVDIVRSSDLLQEVLGPGKLPAQKPEKIIVDLDGSKANLSVADWIQLKPILDKEGLKERINDAIAVRTEEAIRQSADPEFVAKALLGSPVEIEYRNAGGHIVNNLDANRAEIDTSLRSFLVNSLSSNLNSNQAFASLPDNLRQSILNEVNRACSPEFLAVSVNATAKDSFTVATDFDSSGFVKDMARRSVAALTEDLLPQIASMIGGGGNTSST